MDAGRRRSPARLRLLARHLEHLAPPAVHAHRGERAAHAAGVSASSSGRLTKASVDRWPKAIGTPAVRRSGASNQGYEARRRRACHRGVRDQRAARASTKRMRVSTLMMKRSRSLPSTPGSSAAVRRRTSGAGIRQARRSSAWPRPRRRAPACRRDYLRHHAGVHAQPAALHHRHAALAAAIPARRALGEPAPRPACRCGCALRPPQNPASRCRSWLPSRQVAASPDPRSRCSVASEAGPRLTRSPSTTSRSREGEADRREQALEGVATSPAHRRWGRSCARFCCPSRHCRMHPKRPLHGRCPSDLPHPDQRPVRPCPRWRSRPAATRLQVMVESGDAGAQCAMGCEHPTKFLSVVQIGIASVGILNGIVGDRLLQPFAKVAARTLPIHDRAADITRHGDGGGGDHLPLPSSSASWLPKAPRPDVPGGRGAPGGAADGGGSRSRRGPPAAVVLRRGTLRLLGVRSAPDRSVTEGDRRQPRRGPGRRRDRGAGHADGAQRLPPRRPPGRLDDDSARRDRLDRRRRHAQALLAVLAQGSHALSGVPRRARRSDRRGQLAQTAAAGDGRSRALAGRRPGGAGIRARRSPAWSCSNAFKASATQLVFVVDRYGAVQGHDHRDRRRAGSDHRQFTTPPPKTPGRCGATTAAGCSTA